MKNLLITGAWHVTTEDISKLQKAGFSLYFQPWENQELTCPPARIDAIICNRLFEYHNIQRFSRLRFIQLTSAGLDRVPVSYIHAMRIPLYTAKDVYSIPTAEWIVLKILELYKDSRYFTGNQKQHLWEKKRDLLELTGKTVAIIGYGSVGRAAAKRLKSFGVKILAVNHTHMNQEGCDKCYLSNQLNEVLEQSDIVVLTLPLTKATTHLFDQERFKHFKKNAILINVSRGKIVDESALIEVLRSGRVAGAALDAFEDEPLKESKLWDLEHVIITPHNSFVSEFNESRLSNIIFKHLNEWMH